MHRDSTANIILVATIVCMVCSVLVSATTVVLKERQQANRVLDRQLKILEAAELITVGNQISTDRVAQLFERIEHHLIDLPSGDYIEGVDAASYDQREAVQDVKQSYPAPENPSRIQRLPNKALVYHLHSDDGSIESLILPIEGYGLWGTLYGFLVLAPDTTTVKGITFYEHKETPGLGGEVNNPLWKASWKGRKVYDDNWETVLSVKKGRVGPPREVPHGVDGLSGATQTSMGVTNMIHFWFGEQGYGPYLQKFRSLQE